MKKQKTEKHLQCPRCEGRFRILSEDSLEELQGELCLNCELDEEVQREWERDEYD